MGRYFNTAGPCKPKLHYTISRQNELFILIQLIEEQKYFVHHAPRQTGKTTLLKTLCNHLNQQGKYTALYINVESAQTARNDVEEANAVILREIEARQRSSLPNHNYPAIPTHGIDQLRNYLQSWAESSSKPLVLIIDEIDTLTGDSLISVLRQLRSGYDLRPEAFPQSVILNGLRDLRDYRIYSRAEDIWLTGGSCFNIKAESIRMGDFSFHDVKALFKQHEEESRQKLSSELVEEIFRLTEGQPWLCNALGEQLCFKTGANQTELNLDHLLKAKETLILRRDTHLDQLSYRLQEPRVKALIQPIFLGEDLLNPKEDDVQYCLDLGLLKKSDSGYRIANPIYQEVLPRELCYATQEALPYQPNKHIVRDRLQLESVIRDFHEFYREHATADYFWKESTPHILLMAFLQRIVNGGGRIHREYALGSRRLDIAVFFGTQKFALEIKIITPERPKNEVLEKGLLQTAAYMDGLGLQDQGYLFLFDRDLKKPWPERYSWEHVMYEGHQIQVICQ